MKKSVAVIGQGFVGGSLTTVLAEKGLDVFVYDKTGKVAPGGHCPEVPTFVEHPNSTVPGGGQMLPCPVSSVRKLVTYVEKLKNFSGIYFVCLPTPMFEDGSADLSIVEGVLDELANVPGNRIAVVKSTVPPGSTETWNKRLEGTGLRVIHCPEFLTEANALDDMRNQDRIILGGPRPYINKVKQLFQGAFPTVPVIKTSSTNSEMTKYVTNCFLALKVSFANEIYQLCEALDKKGLNADYDRIVECATMDKRLGKSHWKVPSFEVDENGENLRGFSLSCFPKDVNALISKEKELGIEPTMLEATWRKNVEVRPGRDWEKLVGRAVSKKNT